jgi:hypothetical protein
MCSFRRIRSGKSGWRAAPHFRTMIRAQQPGITRPSTCNYRPSAAPIPNQFRHDNFSRLYRAARIPSIPLPSIENVQLCGFSKWKSRNFGTGDITRHQENRTPKSAPSAAFISTIELGKATDRSKSKKINRSVLFFLTPIASLLRTNEFNLMLLKIAKV